MVCRIMGGAGLMGSPLTGCRIADPAVTAVTLYDNFASGREWHYEHHASVARLRVVSGDVSDMQRLAAAMSGHDIVIHLASNLNIARDAQVPGFDFYQDSARATNVLEPTH